MKRTHCGSEVSSAVLVPRWRVGEDGIIYFSVVSNGMTGEQGIAHLEGKGDNVGSYAKSMLRSSGFKPTNGIETEVAVLQGWLWSDNDRTMKNVRREAKKRKFRKLNAEVACLICDMFTDEEFKKMGIWWLVVVHKLIASDGGPRLLGVRLLGGGRWLDAFSDAPLRKWSRDRAFAFAVPASLPAAGR